MLEFNHFISTIDLSTIPLHIIFQAFLKTAEGIYSKIKDGVYDPSREGNGVKLGVMAAQPKNANKSAQSNCC